MMHSCRAEVEGRDWEEILAPMIHMWENYVRTFLERTSEPREVALFQLREIAYQSIAWTGFAMSKYFSPQFFQKCVTRYMRAPVGLLESLGEIHFSQKDMDGREYLRSTTFALGHALMATGCKGKSKYEAKYTPDEQSLNNILKRNDSEKTSDCSNSSSIDTLHHRQHRRSSLTIPC
mmetsp:Transcript_5408/g.8331  ORF Transcript_5408/g.8331 Transcript_5408/m.8331 type:complete len:177 (-) Transcript_5408:378-908(-)